MERRRHMCGSILRSYFKDFVISLQILLKFLLVSWLALSLLQTDYTRLFSLQQRRTHTIDAELKTSNISRPRIFCLIFTSVERHDYIAVHGQSTWIRNCDRYLFVSNDIHPILEPLVIKNRYRWGAILISFSYVYRYYGDEMDWLLKVNDDNFVILENLRYLLQSHAPDDPINFGCKMKDNENQTYMYGGVNVLSREALRRLVTDSFTNSNLCQLADSLDDDEELGRCLRNVGVTAGDSRDTVGRQRFVPFSPEEYFVLLKPNKEDWYFARSYYEINATTRGISKDVISFSNINPAKMVSLFYYVYRLKIFGRKVQTEIFNGTSLIKRLRL